MNWIQLNLCFVVLALLMPSHFVSGEDNQQTSFHDEDEILSSDRSHDALADAMAYKSSSNQFGERIPRQSQFSHNNRHVGDYMGQLTRGLLPASLIGQPLDAQASSASKNVVYSLNNLNSFADITKPAEETVKRFTRNPEVMDDIVGQFQDLGGGVTKNLLQQVSQSAPDMSKSFGQALNEALTQTNLLAQVAPGNLDLSQLTQPLSQSNLPGSLDLGQLGQVLSQNFLTGATQNLLGALSGQGQSARSADAAPVAEDAESTDKDTVGSVAESEKNSADAGSQKNPLEQMVGQSLLPGLPSLPQLSPLASLSQLNPLSVLGQLSPLGPLLSMGSEISEVRVLPEQDSPFKVSPKEVENQIMAEMKLKSVLKEALAEKTIPILWFHLPKKDKEQKTSEELELEAKLEEFEQQIIAELKQLQELAKLANELKKTQLESGAEPTHSLTKKLNLAEIPLHDITLGDIEKTLKDEHVMMVMQTLVQKKKNFERHQQVTTRYITNLEGMPTKRQASPNEESLRNMQKDDVMKMMTYAYRMAALHGHEMPWIKTKISSIDDTADRTKSAMASQQRQIMNDNMQMSDEMRWLADKEQHMAIEAKRLTMNRQMQQPQLPQGHMEPISDMRQSMQQQQQGNQRQMHMPQQMPMQRQQQQRPPMMNAFEVPQEMPMQRQQQQRPPMMNAFEVPQEMPMQRQQQQPPMMNTFDIPQQMPMQRQQQQPPMMDTFDIPQEMPMQRQHQQRPPMMNAFEVPQEMPMQRQQQQRPPMMNAFEMPQEMPMQRQQQQRPPMMFNMEGPQQMPMQRQRQQQGPPMMINMDGPQQMPMQRQQQQPPMMQMRSADSKSEQDEDRKDKTSKDDESKKDHKNDTSKSDESKKSPDPKPEQSSETKSDKKSKNIAGSEQPKLDSKSPSDEIVSKARMKGLDDLKLDLFPETKPPVVINYYYNSGSGGGSSYPSYHPPASPQYGSHGGYGGGGGGGGYAGGHNHYSSGYRTATGDEEIAEMLQAQQSDPKMMMKKKTQNSKEPTTTTTITTPKKTTNEKTTNENTEDLNKSELKRLAKKQNESFSDNAAAYVVVLRENDNRSSSGSRSGIRSGSRSSTKSSRLRQKRSTEYATLEPIDESSLEALRKTYRNSLKEITLNPNETPAQALMRYNAESVREAMEKANKQPMEISAGGEEDAEVRGDNATDGVEQHQHAMPEQISNSLPQTYALNENGPYLPVTTTQEALVANGPYVTQPLTVAYNHLPSPATAYDSSGLQAAVINNIISKYHTPGAYSSNNKYIAQNPYLQMHTPLDSVPYMDNNSMAKHHYQLANQATVDGIESTAKALVYQMPQLGFNNYLSHANAINKNLQYVTDYEMPSKNSLHAVQHLLNKNAYTSAFSPFTPAQDHIIQSYTTESPRDSFAINNIIALVKQQLVECCNKCKNDILQSLEETLKRQHYENSISGKPHTLTHRNPSTRDEDSEYKQWLADMSNKGYSRAHLSKEHYHDYVKNDKLNLHLTGDGEGEGGGDSRHEVENIFFKNNQSYKRDTTLAAIELDTDKETDMVTAATTHENETENIEEEDDDLEAESDAEADGDEIEVVSENQIIKTARDKKSLTNAEKENELEPANNKNHTLEDAKLSSKVGDQPSLTTTNTIESPETNTPSMYTLRGQFRPNKPNAMASSAKQSKKFANYKSINKLGKTDSGAAKSQDKEKTDEKAAEMLDVPRDVNDQNTDVLAENFSTTTPSATTSTTSTSTSTTIPLTTAATNSISKTSNGTELAEQTTSKKLSRRKSKTRKSSPKGENTK